MKYINRGIRAVFFSIIHTGIYYLSYHLGWLFLNKILNLEYRLSWNILVTFTIISCIIAALVQNIIREYTSMDFTAVAVIGVFIFGGFVYPNLLLSPYRTGFITLCFTFAYFVSQYLYSRYMSTSDR